MTEVSDTIKAMAAELRAARDRGATLQTRPQIPTASGIAGLAEMLRRARAARVEAGDDPHAAKMQTAQERAVAEQRERDRLEAERIRRLLALDDAKAKRAPRKPPRFDPVKSAAKMVAKNPNLVMRLKSDGEMEIASAIASSPVAISEIEMDASKNDDVWNAINAIRNGGHGAH